MVSVETMSLIAIIPMAATVFFQQITIMKKEELIEDIVNENNRLKIEAIRATKKEVIKQRQAIEFATMNGLAV